MPPGSTFGRLALGLPLLAVMASCAGAVDVAPPRPPSAETKAACGALGAALPDTVGGQAARETAPGSRLTAAWGDPPITLRCGVSKPAAYTKTAQLLDINEVAWLPVPQDAAVPTRFYVVERVAYIEVVVPKEHSPASDSLVDVGHAIEKHVEKDPNAKP